MIVSVRFRNFRALRSAEVRLEPFNLVVGPNGSGKTSLIEALRRLQVAAAGASAAPPAARAGDGTEAELEFSFAPPFAALRVTLHVAPGAGEGDGLSVAGPAGAAGWAELRARLATIRGFAFDHAAMARPARRAAGARLAGDAGNLAAVLAAWHAEAPAVFAALVEDFRRIMPEFAGLEFGAAADGAVELRARLEGKGDGAIAAGCLSQGTLHLLGVLALAHDPAPPAVVCLEELDRGVHPRMLREVRDALYALSHPEGPAGAGRSAVQVITTAHSPYLLDLFRDHPEEVVLANKTGNRATFARLADLVDLRELMGEASLGDLWYSGILGGVPGAGGGAAGESDR